MPGSGRLLKDVRPAARSLLVAASGDGKCYAKSAKIIRFVRQGCTNRPFFQIVVTERRRDQYMPVIEQVGTYDEMANKYNQQMVSLNIERIRHWLGSGAHLSRPVAELLGLAGLLPVYPKTYQTAWRNRKAIQEAAEKAAAEEASAASAESSKSTTAPAS